MAENKSNTSGPEKSGQDTPKAADAAGSNEKLIDASKNPKPDEIGKALRAAGVSPSADTAAGLAARGEVKTPAHDHKGGAGADEIEDTGIKPGEPKGAQTQPALFTPSGSIPHASVPSPTGLVPATVAGPDAEAALAAQREGLIDSSRGKTGRYRISDEYAANMTPAELRAVAHDRGYEIREGGRRALLHNFLAEQENDEGLEDPPEGSKYATRGGYAIADRAPEGSVTVPGPTGAAAGADTTTGGRPPAAAIKTDRSA